MNKQAVPAQPAPTPDDEPEYPVQVIDYLERTKPIPPTSAPESQPKELSDYDIQMIHNGLLIPNEKAIHSMAREIRKWRGEANPDAV